MSDNQVEQVKQKTDIVDIIGDRVTLKRAGRNLKGLCPFHSEKTPSFFVTPDMQMFKCFGCGESGDVFSFIQKYEGLTFPETLEMLAKRAGITLVRTYRTEADNTRERYLEILHLASEYYHFLLMEHKVGERARNYLKNRGVTKQSLKDFMIGYSPESWQGVQDFLVKKKKYTPEELLATGLVISRQGGGYYDRFRGRVMFPQQTVTGQVVGFSARTLDPEAKEAKYINTPETGLYHKGELLYGMSQARSAIRVKDRIVVVEGELDVISSRQANLKEVVAVKGSALTEGQIKLIGRMTHNALLSLDADEAGQEAIKRAIELGEPAGMNLRVVQLVGGKDPDEIAKTDPHAWKELVDKAVSVYQFYLDTALHRFEVTTGTGQKQISQFLVPVFNRIDNGVEKSFWIKKLAEKLHVGTEVVEGEMRRQQMGGMTSPKTKEMTEVKPKITKRQERLERYVLAAILHLNRDFKKNLDLLLVDWFTEDYLKRFLKGLRETRDQVTDDEVKETLLVLPEEWRHLAQELYSEDQALLTAIESEKTAIFIQAKRDLRELALRRQLNEVVAKMGKVDLDESEKLKLQASYQRLERELKSDSE